jgi:hypothetical protein
MPRNLVCLFVLVLTLACWGCAATQQAPPVRVPPQIDLRERETIGVIRFASSAKGELGPMATRRFTEAARRDQGLVRIVDLGSQAQALQTVGRDRLVPDALIALGRKHGVKTIVTGELAVSKVRPDVSIDAMFRSGSVTAQVDATLDVQMYEVDTGATLWNRSARATHSVGQVQVWGGKQFDFNAKNPEEAYGGLVDDLVAQVSRPFQVSWVRP